jgi:hypothetical protein
MQTPNSADALVAFGEHITELAKTWYEWDEAKGFRHAAMRFLSQDSKLSDEEIARITGIAAIRDLDIGGGVVDEASHAIMLMQSTGYNTKTDVERVEQFWEAPERLLAAARRTAILEQPSAELAQALQASLRNGDTLRMVFVSRGGFTTAAAEFARTKSNVEKNLFLPSGGQVTCWASLELVDELQLALSYATEESTK